MGSAPDFHQRLGTASPNVQLVSRAEKAHFVGDELRRDQCRDVSSSNIMAAAINEWTMADLWSFAKGLSPSDFDRFVSTMNFLRSAMERTGPLWVLGRAPVSLLDAAAATPRSGPVQLVECRVYLALTDGQISENIEPIEGAREARSVPIPAELLAQP
jgi:hypothetical protein